MAMTSPIPAGRKRGPAPSLSREQICAAALEAMASEGLAAVSFRSVAKRLGVNPMALYTYVNSKEQLLADIYDSVMDQLRLDPDSTATPVEQLVDFYDRARVIITANAELYRLVRSASIAGADFSTQEAICALLEALGLDDQSILTTQQTLLQFTVGNALYWSALNPSGPAKHHVEEAQAAMSSLDPERFPILQRIANLDLDEGPEQRFRHTIRQLLSNAVAGGGQR